LYEQILHILSVCLWSNRAFKAHVPYRVAILYFSSHFFTNDTIFGKSYFLMLCFYLFSLQFFFWNISNSKKNSERNAITKAQKLFLSDFNETWNFRKNLRKFHENPPSGSRVIIRGQTDMTKLVDS